MDESKIVWRNYGIADRLPDGTIEMNKHLKDYPELKTSLLLHEAQHTNRKKMNKKDFFHDLTSLNQLHIGQLIKFMCRHPLSIIQILPIYKTKTAGWAYDEVAIIFWTGILAVVGIGAWIGFSL